MQKLEKRLETLEQAADATNSRKIVILLFGDDTEADSLARRGLSSDTDASFIRIVPLKPTPTGGKHAHIE